MKHGPRFQKLAAEAKSHVREISPSAAAAQQEKNAVLIDVREHDEFLKEHAPSAIHLSKGVIEMRIEEQVPDPATPLICYCGGGNRSALVVENLQRMGYSDVSSMAGGFKAWKGADLPTTA